MQIDLEEVRDRSEFKSSVCIVGGGIAGLLLARRLAGHGIDVHLLEAGGHTLESRSQEMYDVEMAGKRHEGATEGRFRVFGGSSTRWGGQLLPYTPDIFNPPAGTPSAKWPICAADVEPYYAELQTKMHVTSRPLDRDFLQLFQQDQSSASRTSDVNIRFSKWIAFSRRNLANTVGRECIASSRIGVFLHANVTSIEVRKEQGLAERIIAKSYNGKTFGFYARYFAVCAGTIESCRLLLASRAGFDCGIGNATDQVGRYFHDHISAAVATVPASARGEFERLFSPVLVERTVHTAKLEASAALRNKHNLLAVMAHFAIEEPEGSGIAALRDFFQEVQSGKGFRKLAKAALALPRSSADIARMSWCASVRKRRAISCRATIRLRLDSEQLPSAERRITLSARRDPLGMPRSIIHWSVSEEERRTMQVYAKVVERFLSRLGLGPLDWRPELWEQSDAWLNITRDTYHAMGGTRMGTNPHISVVDPNLRVYGVSNLFISSCSVFPGGGSSNPTFTLMALALRLGTHLAKLCSDPVASHWSTKCDMAAIVPKAIPQDVNA